MRVTLSLLAVWSGLGKFQILLTCFHLTRTRPWYASQVMGLVDLPEPVQKTLGKKPQGSVVVRRFGFDDLKVIRPDWLDSLGENRVNRSRAAVSDDIGRGYDIALGMINGDI